MYATCSKNEVTLSVFKDEVFSGHTDDDNLIDITVTKDCLFNWFKENILESFKGDDKEVSDNGLLEEWLDEYTADDASGLYAYAVRNYGLRFIHSN